MYIAIRINVRPYMGIFIIVLLLRYEVDSLPFNYTCIVSYVMFEHVHGISDVQYIHAYEYE